MGDIKILYHDIEKKHCDITIYGNIFSISINSKLCAIIMNKEIPNVDDVYLKLDPNMDIW